MNLSCGSKPTDVRSVVPADALIYLETNDLGKAVGSITESTRFQALAKRTPDLSALNGIRMAVAVTGFETSEQQVNDENSVLSFQPHFVAVAETNAWSWQTASFTENKLGEFINEAYDGEVELDITPKSEGKYYVWKAQDGRKAFALVQGSVIFFGNDESAIEKCQAVRRGEADSIAKNPKIAPPPDSLAFGYVSPDGIAQLSNLTGISLAMKAGEESEVKSFIARVLPEILRNSVKELTWNASKQNDGRIEDRYSVSLNAETAKVFGETMVPSSDADPDLSRFVPSDVVSSTRYNFKDPQVAWRSVVLTAQNRTDQLSGKLLAAFSGSLFESYAVEDPEMFLSASGNVLQTATFDAAGEDAVVVTRVRDLERLKRSLAKEINFAKPPEKVETAHMWRSEDAELAAAFVESRVVLGDAGSVERCLRARVNGESLVTVSMNSRIQGSTAPITTIGSETDPAAKLVTVLAERKDENAPLAQTFLTETRFTQAGIERTTVSDFGLIGSIIEQFGKE